LLDLFFSWVISLQKRETAVSQKQLELTSSQGEEVNHAQMEVRSELAEALSKEERTHLASIGVDLSPVPNYDYPN